MENYYSETMKRIGIAAFVVAALAALDASFNCANAAIIAPNGTYRVKGEANAREGLASDPNVVDTDYVSIPGFGAFQAIADSGQRSLGLTQAQSVARLNVTDFSSLRIRTNGSVDVTGDTAQALPLYPGGAADGNAYCQLNLYFWSDADRPFTLSTQLAQTSASSGNASVQFPYGGGGIRLTRELPSGLELLNLELPLDAGSATTTGTLEAGVQYRLYVWLWAAGAAEVQGDYSGRENYVVDLQVVPEPTGLSAVGAALLLLGRRRRESELNLAAGSSETVALRQ